MHLPLPRRELSLRELVEQTGALLRRLPIKQRDGRTASEPDARAVRYYVSLGLVDPPSGRDGSRALYEERHVLQLLAIKTLQADGLALNAVAQRLEGRGNAELAALLGPLGEATERSMSPRLPAGTDLVLSVQVQPGLAVLVAPSVLQDRARLPAIAEAIEAALQRAARALRA